MIDEERLEKMLRAALEHDARRGPSRDLWPLILERSRLPSRWSWLDLGIAVMVSVALLMRPGWLWVLAYHL